MKRELRTKSVGTKVSEAELRVLESRAERAGLTLSFCIELRKNEGFRKAIQTARDWNSTEVVKISFSDLNSKVTIMVSGLVRG